MGHGIKRQHILPNNNIGPTPFFNRNSLEYSMDNHSDGSDATFVIDHINFVLVVDHVTNYMYWYVQLIPESTAAGAA